MSACVTESMLIKLCISLRLLTAHSDHIILSAIQPETIAGRVEDDGTKKEETEEENKS